MGLVPSPIPRRRNPITEGEVDMAVRHINCIYYTAWNKCIHPERVVGWWHRKFGVVCIDAHINNPKLYQRLCDYRTALPRNRPVPLPRPGAVLQTTGNLTQDQIEWLSKLGQAGINGGQAGERLREAFLQLHTGTRDAPEIYENKEVTKHSIDFILE